VLVDRVWPRGLTKDAAHLDAWIKDAAPSTPLRHWYGHRPERFTEFRRRYLAELADPQPAAAMNRLRELTRTCVVAEAEPNQHPAAPVAAGSAGPGARCASRMARAAWMSAAWVSVCG
jgi:uncharacterized protein YeaO (DUF488 family)